MRRRGGGFGCGCGGDGPPVRYGQPGMGGIFSKILDVASLSVGGPPNAGDELASFGNPAFGAITQTPAEIATTVLPDAQTALANLSGINVPNITPASQQIAQAILPQAAAALTSAGYVFPPGSVGANLQHPSALDAFGGGNAQWVLVGGLALGALLLFKEL